MRRIYQIAVVVALLALLHACCRQRLEDAYVITARIPVQVDWSQTYLEVGSKHLYSASLWLFPHSDSEYQGAPLEYRMNNPSGQYIDVPVGKYAVLVFNNTVSDFSDAVSFRGTDRYETFEYYALPVVSTDDQDQLKTPDPFAVWNMDLFEVTPEMVSQTIYLPDAALTKTEDDIEEQLAQLTSVTPQHLTYNVTVKVRVKGLNRALPPVQAVLTNISHSVLLSTGKKSQTTKTHPFELRDVIWKDEQQKDGILQTNFHILARDKVSVAQSLLTCQFTLIAPHDGSVTYPTPPAPPFSKDVTESLLSPSSNTILLEMGTGIGGDDVIQLPDVTVSGGFDVDVGDWEESEVIPLD